MTTQRAVRLAGIARLAAACSLVVQEVPRPELGGTCSVEGRALDGGSYTVTATIHREWVGTYSIPWLISGATFTGTGKRRGDDLEVRWFRSGTQGRAHPTLSSTGVLHGTWSMDEDSRLGLETLTPDSNP
ncbi:MAG: hypothetical protein NTY23_04095 [Chloroflexi bacterium]|nr:hypothetical protein [Chloroflexota bacterium]